MYLRLEGQHRHALAVRRREAACAVECTERVPDEGDHQRSSEVIRGHVAACAVECTERVQLLKRVRERLRRRR